LQHQSPQVPRSIWGNVDDNKVSHQSNEPGVNLGVWGDDSAARESPNSFYNQVQQQREVGSLQQFDPQPQPQQQLDDQSVPVVNEDPDQDTGFVKPKANEKKDKKTKRAEEKKRAREREAKKAANNANEYIPGMEGSVRPADEIINDEIEEEFQQRHYEEELEHHIEAEPEQVVPQFQPKLAPWAKVSVDNSSTPNGAESSLSLAEIQKLEEEREREAKMRRDIQEAAQARARQEEEARRQQSIGLNWATAANSMDQGGAQKSLAEIQAEEQRQERDRQERERREKKARQKDMSLAQASVWGSASTNLSWANKTTPPVAPVSNPAPVQQQPSAQYGNNTGFWDESPPVQQQQKQQPQQQQQQQQQQKKNKNNKKIKEENKVAAIFKESKGKPENEFEEWCISALEKLDPQVDIPTFLGFLNDVESPYEVNDYVKNYIGDGKGPKNFAKEYVERRSKWRNALKSKKRFEDDLLTPAAAINPNIDDGVVPVVGGGLTGSGAGLAGAGARRNKKKNKSKSKLDASHLLGFSVASADRHNAGELDLPQ